MGVFVALGSGVGESVGVSVEVGVNVSVAVGVCVAVLIVLALAPLWRMFPGGCVGIAAWAFGPAAPPRALCWSGAAALADWNEVGTTVDAIPEAESFAKAASSAAFSEVLVSAGVVVALTSAGASGALWALSSVLGFCVAVASAATMAP